MKVGPQISTTGSNHIELFQRKHMLLSVKKKKKAKISIRNDHFLHIFYSQVSIISSEFRIQFLNFNKLGGPKTSRSLQPPMPHPSPHPES